MDGLTRRIIIFLFFLTFSSPSIASDSVLNYSRQRIGTILQNEHAQLKDIINQLAGYPYLVSKGANNPLYRLDGFDCQTFVQTTMALLRAKSLIEFESNYIKIAYGAMPRQFGHDITYYNRNHFVEVDLNPVNQRNGFFTDITSKGILASFAKTISATIDRAKWFSRQGRHFVYPTQDVTIAYVPKESLVLRSTEGSYQPNTALLASIPTPSVVEMINDPEKWIRNGKTIKERIGTQLTVSHMGFLYRQNFKKGELIYRRISCGLNWNYKKTCQVYSVRCMKSSCDELMFAHATDEYPNGFYWYKQYGEYVCSPSRPPSGVAYTRCNRVEKIPLYSYLTNYHYGSYWNMSNESLLGIHIEQLH